MFFSLGITYKDLLNLNWRFSLAYNNNSKAARRRRKRRRRILRAVLPVFIAIFFIFLIIFLGIKLEWFADLFDSNERADLNSYFQCMSADTATVYWDGEMSQDRITVKDNRLYGDMDTILKSFNDEFYWEDTSGRLLYTTGDGVYITMPESSSYDLNGTIQSAGGKTCFLKGDKLMISLDYVKMFTNFEYNLYGGGKEPYRLEIKTKWGSDTVADIKKDDLVLRIDANSGSEILKDLKEGETVKVGPEVGEDWIEVTTMDLYTGFIKKKYLTETRTVTGTPVNNAITINIPMVADYSKPVILAWHNVTNEDSSKYLKDYLKYLDCVNTISPTWFALLDNDGTVASIASKEYVNLCHERGIKVWGLVDNMTYDISSYKILSVPEKRTHVINQLLEYASNYELDGINVDFESVPEEAGPHFVQFIRELCLAAHPQGLVISVDNYVPQGHTLHYNRKEQGVFADYVIIMGYDEHTNGSEEAGSVSSIDFVIDGIDKTLADVPTEKVINGLPFYARLWNVTDTGVITDVQTLPMPNAIATVKNAGIEARWDDETQQNYAEWPSGGGINKIWLEDADSLRSKLEAMKSKNIGGVAVWQLAFSNDSAWEVINEYYRP